MKIKAILLTFFILSLTLAPAYAQYGSIYISSSPAGASVSLSGAPVGSTPLLLESIHEGSQSISVSMAGYKTAYASVEVKKDLTSRIHLVLTPLAPKRPKPVTPPPQTPSYSPTPTPEPAPEPQSWLNINSTPPGATIFIDNYPKGKTPAAKLPVKPGTHLIRLSLKGYKDDGGSVTAVKGATAKSSWKLIREVAVKPSPVESPAPTSSSSPSVELTPTAALPGQESTITFESEPPGAKVVIDGEEIDDITPLEHILPAGEHTVKFIKKGFIATEEHFTSEAQQNSRVQVALIPKGVDTGLQINSEPPGASIQINKNALGKTPRFVSQIKPGKYNFSLALEGFESYSGTLKINKGKITKLKVTLTVHSGSVDITSTPPGATIYLGEEFYGKTPRVLDEIKPGKYVLKLSLSGYQKYEQPITVEAGKSISVSTKLVRTGIDPFMIFFFGMIILTIVMLIAGLTKMKSEKKGPAQEDKMPTSPIITFKSSPEAKPYPPEPAPAAAAPKETVAFTPPPAKDPLEGKSLGNYHVLNKMTEGRTSTLYKAQHRILKGNVVLKIPYDYLAKDGVFVKRFKRGAEIGRGLYHSNIVRTFESGEEDGILYWAMELVNGSDLRKIIKQEAPINIRIAIDIVSQICQALDHAHMKGIVHQGIKPENILVAKDGKVKVSDFGVVAPMLPSGSLLAESFPVYLLYMSPEQLNQGEVDYRSDIYALGVVFYELVTANPPYASDNVVQLMEAIRNDIIATPRSLNADVPAAIESVILKMLEKDPKHRYQDAREVLVDLQRFLSSIGI